MKKYLLIAALALPMSGYAGGIPVFDAASIARMAKDAIENAKQFKQQMDQYKAEFDELKEQGEHYKKMVEGHITFEDVLYDKNLNNYLDLDDLKELYETVNVEEIKQELGIDDDSGRYDYKFRKYAMQKKFYKGAQQRSNNLKELLESFKTATTPSAKADISNAIAAENIAIKNDQAMADAMNKMMEQQERLNHERKMKRRNDILLGEGIPRPKRS